MKHLLKYLLGATAVLILAAVAVLYAVPEWLKQREIRAAEADLALLAAPPALPPSVKNGIDALWLLQYRTKDDAERADLMRRFGEVLKYTPDTFARHNELADRYLPPPDDDILTFTGTAAEYLSQIRANLPKYRAEAEKHRLQNPPTRRQMVLFRMVCNSPRATRLLALVAQRPCRHRARPEKAGMKNPATWAGSKKDETATRQVGEHPPRQPSRTGLH